MANDSKDTDNIDAYLTTQYTQSFGEVADLRREQSIKQLKSNDQMLRKQVEEECAAHRISVEQHKKLIRQIQAVTATNDKLQECFLQTEVTHQREKDTSSKVEIQKRNELTDIESRLADVENEIEQMQQRKAVLSKQCSDTSKVLEKLSEMNDVLEGEISALQDEHIHASRSLSKVEEDLKAAAAQLSKLETEQELTIQSKDTSNITLQHIQEQNSVKQAKIRLVQQTVREIETANCDDNTILHQYRDELKETENQELHINKKKCRTKTAVSNLKKENEFHFQTLNAIIEQIMNLKANVLFCEQCRAAPTCDYHVERCTLPEITSSTMQLRVQDYSQEIRRTNEQLNVYDLPCITVKEDSCP